MSRKLSMILVTLLTVCLVLTMTACATATPTKGSTTPTAVPTASGPDISKTVALTQYIVGSEQPDLQVVNDEMNKILKEKINATVSVKLLDWGSYGDRIKVIISSAEEFDLCFTSPWLNNYVDNVNKGAYVALDEYLPVYAPKAYAAIPAKFWDAARIGGKIYGFLNYQIFARTDAFAIRTEFADKYKFDPSKVVKLEDLEPLMEAIKTSEPNMLPIHIGTSEGDQIVYNMLNYMGYEEIAGHVPGAILQTSTDGKVINQFADEKYKAMFQLMRKWYLAGYFRADIATIQDVTAERRAGKFAIETEGTFKPGGISELATMMNLTVADFKEVLVSKPYAATGGIIATMFGVSKTSKNPERAVMYLEQLNTNVDLYNLMCFGIKDKHYTQDAEGYVSAVDASAYSPVTDWEFGNQFNALYRKGNEKGNWDKTVELNASAAVSPILGFSFDANPVKTEIAQCQAIIAEYMPILGTGSGDFDKVYPEFIGKLNTAGAEKIVAEMQKQLDAWKTTK